MASSGNTVVDAIMAATSNNPDLRSAMLLGSRMESGWRANAVGDQGTSLGPFQIHLPAHPGVTAAQAENPAWAVNYMMPSYQNGVNKVPSSMWSSNPGLAAATAAYYAERPAKMYATSTWEADWKYVTQALQGLPVSGGDSNNPAGGLGGDVNSGGTSGGVSTASVVDSILGPIETDFSDVFNKVYMAGVIIGGVAIMAVGFILLMRAGFEAMPNSSSLGRSVYNDATRSRGNGGQSDKRDDKSVASGAPESSRRRATPHRLNRPAERERSQPPSGRNEWAPTRRTVVYQAATRTAARPRPKQTRIVESPSNTKALP